MRIEDLRIERFGRWNETTLSLPDPAVNVLYGPNEAGKSTLLRFVRGVLYGRGASVHDDRRPDELRGRLVVEHDGHRHAIERHYDDRTNVADVDALDGPAVSLDELRQGVERPFFERVYAVGLREMQELGTLDDAAVADWLYGTSLGPAGRRLGEIGAFAGRSRSTLVGSSKSSGRIADLTNEYARLSRELDGLDDPDRHDALRIERVELESKVDQLRRGQQNLQRNLRGYRALARVHEPWQQVREYRGELDRLGRASRVPKGGLDSLSTVEAKITETRNRRDATAKRVKGLIAEYKTLPKSDSAEDLGDCDCTLKALLEQRDEIRDVQRRVNEIGGRLRTARSDFDRAIEELGPDWDEKRLAEVSGTTDGYGRLNAAAREYQKGLVRRARLRRLRKRLSKTVKKRQAELHERTRALGGMSVKEAMADRRQRLVDLEELGRLRIRASELEQRRQGLVEQIETSKQQSGLPDWVHGVLAFFGIAGLVFVVAGLTTSIRTSWLVGAIYACLGLTVGGLCWAIKLHFEEGLRETLRRLRDEETSAEKELSKTRERIANLQGTDSRSLAVAKLSLRQQQERDAELVSGTVRELVDLERLMERIDSTVGLRKRQTIVRNRFHSLQRELGNARQKWAGTIRELGLGETLKVEEAIAEWDRVVVANDARRRLRAAEGELSRERVVRERFRTRMQTLAADLGERYDDDKALELLDRWSQRLGNSSRSERSRGDDERRRRRREIREGRREYERLRNELSKWRLRRSSLFAKAGVGSRTEFQSVVGSVGRRTELEELLALAEADLEAATKGDEDLAIVEEQLLDYDPTAARETIELAELEIEENETELRKGLERLGHVKKSLADLEGDERAASLRFERERVYEQLRDATRELAATELVERAAESTVGELERTHQPPTLAAASRYLAKLTLGRYDRVWTPFGESRLLVNGDGHEALGVEKLSRGTREQVFLALRLAMIERLAEGVDGRPPVRLPLVLDDVLVNFDRDRTEAAVDTLIDFARDGRQVLFLTCHEHVATMFEDRGVEPVWLPANEARLEERIAG